MSLGIISTIILLGLLLVVAEFFLIPGTTLVGFAGGIIMVGGIYLAYAEHGAKAGNIALALTGSATLFLFYIGFKAYSSRKFSLNEAIDSRVNTLDESLVKVGDEGVTASQLRPNGKALINSEKIEVFSLGEYIENNTKVKVVKIAENKIYVKPLNS